MRIGPRRSCTVPGRTSPTHRDHPQLPFSFLHKRTAKMATAGALCRTLSRRGALALPGQTQRGAAGAAAPAAAPAAEEASSPVRPYEDIPGPKPLPVFGNLWRFLPGIGPWSKGDFLDLHHELRKTYGNIVKMAGMARGRDMVAVYDPVDIEKVYRMEGPWPRRDAFESLGYYRRVIKKEKYEGAHGLLTTNDQEWQDFRRRVQNPMLQPRAVARYTGPIDLVAAEFLDRVREIRGKDGTLPEDADNWLFRWALESIATIALDARLGCLASDVAGEPQELIDSVQVLFEGMFKLDIMPSLWRYVSTPMWRRYVKAIENFEDVAHKYIQKTMDNLKAKMDAGQLGDDLSVLERLILANDNPRIASTMALDMLFAGIDTTSYATATLLYLLSRNPDKQEELYKELRTVLPEKDTPVTPERLAQMKYLRGAIKESMRMRPVAIGQMRENTHDGFVLRNYSIPKGVDIIMMLSVTGNDPQYIPEANRFMPERWLRGEQSAKGHPFAMLPFGFGPRICIGKRFAELEIEVLNAKLLRNFRVDYDREVKFETRLLHVIRSPLTFRLTDRE